MENDSIGCSGSLPFADNAPPEEFLLLRYGKNVFTKSGEQGEFEFNEADADLVIAEFASRGRDLVIDYEHQSLGREKAPAAGWIDALKKSAQGLIAHVKYWTNGAARAISELEYRYFSPTLYFSEDGQRVAALHSVALTNHPALHGVPALAADDLEEELIRLMDLSPVDLADSSLHDVCCTRIGELVRLEKDLTGWLAEQGFEDLTAVKHELTRSKCAALVSEAFRDGKLTESERHWAETFAAADPAAFRAWCLGAPRRIPDNHDTQEREPQQKSATPGATESQILHLLGLDEEAVSPSGKKKN